MCDHVRQNTSKESNYGPSEVESGPVGDLETKSEEVYGEKPLSRADSTYGVARRDSVACCMLGVARRAIVVRRACVALMDVLAWTGSRHPVQWMQATGDMPCLIDGDRA